MAFFQPMLLGVSQHVIWGAEAERDAQIGEEDESGPIRIDGAALVKQLAGSVEAAEHDHILSEHDEPDNVSWVGHG